MEVKKSSIVEKLKDEFVNPRKRKPLIVGVIVFIVVFIALTKYHSAASSAQGDVIVPGGGEAPVQEQIDDAGGTEADSASSAAESERVAESAAAAEDDRELPTSGYIFVDIGGAVRDGGVIALPAGSRVSDAITASGGLTEDADVRYLNRAATLSDGDRIYVPTTLELQAGTAPPSAGQVGAGGGGSGSTSGAPAAESAPGLDTAGRVNLNTADSATLQTLTGVGPSIAQKIIDYRTKSGGFKRIEDLMNVSGIGQKTFEKLKEHIIV